MRIHFDGVNFASSTGPNTFANRLARQLFESGHEVTGDGPSSDVSLVFIERSGAPLARTVIQRLDGIWSRPQDYLTKNINIRSLYESAAAIVFQSQFDKTMIERRWGLNDERQRHAPVIGNGIDLKPVKEITIPRLAEMRSQYEKIFVCSSNWHAQKRLKSNVELFDHLRTTQFPNSCLIVMGDHPDYRATGPHVFYTGSVGSDVYMQVYSAADWMIHLAWGDHCPNCVVEALSQGTPVICSNVGGTKELIGHGAYGMVLKEQNVYDFALIDYEQPPEIDVTQCTFLPTRQELDYNGIPTIDICNVAEQYMKLFTSLLP